MQQVAQMKGSDIRGQPLRSPKSIMGSATATSWKTVKPSTTRFLIGTSVRMAHEAALLPGNGQPLHRTQKRARRLRQGKSPRACWWTSTPRAKSSASTSIERRKSSTSPRSRPLHFPQRPRRNDSAAGRLTKQQVPGMSAAKSETASRPAGRWVTPADFVATSAPILNSRQTKSRCQQRSSSAAPCGRRTACRRGGG